MPSAPLLYTPLDVITLRHYAMAITTTARGMVTEGHHTHHSTHPPPPPPPPPPPTTDRHLQDHDPTEMPPIRR